MLEQYLYPLPHYSMWQKMIGEIENNFKGNDYFSNLTRQKVQSLYTCRINSYNREHFLAIPTEYFAERQTYYFTYEHMDWLIQSRRISYVGPLADHLVIYVINRYPQILNENFYHRIVNQPKVLTFVIQYYPEFIYQIPKEVMDNQILVTLGKLNWDKLALMEIKDDILISNILGKLNVNELIILFKKHPLYLKYLTSPYLIELAKNPQFARLLGKIEANVLILFMQKNSSEMKLFFSLISDPQLENLMLTNPSFFLFLYRNPYQEEFLFCKRVKAIVSSWTFDEWKSKTREYLNIPETRSIFLINFDFRKFPAESLLLFQTSEIAQMINDMKYYESEDLAYFFNSLPEYLLINFFKESSKCYLIKENYIAVLNKVQPSVHNTLGSISNELDFQQILFFAENFPQFVKFLSRENLLKFISPDSFVLAKYIKYFEEEQIIGVLESGNYKSIQILQQQHITFLFGSLQAYPQDKQSFFLISALKNKCNEGSFNEVEEIKKGVLSIPKKVIHSLFKNPLLSQSTLQWLFDILVAGNQTTPPLTNAQKLQFLSKSPTLTVSQIRRIDLRNDPSIKFEEVYRESIKDQNANIIKVCPLFVEDFMALNREVNWLVALPFMNLQQTIAFLKVNKGKIDIFIYVKMLLEDPKLENLLKSDLIIQKNQDQLAIDTFFNLCLEGNRVNPSALATILLNYAGTDAIANLLMISSQENFHTNLREVIINSFHLNKIHANKLWEMVQPVLKNLTLTAEYFLNITKRVDLKNLTDLQRKFLAILQDHLLPQVFKKYKDLAEKFDFINQYLNNFRKLSEVEQFRAAPHLFSSIPDENVKAQFASIVNDSKSLITICKTAKDVEHILNPHSKTHTKMFDSVTQMENTLVYFYSTAEEYGEKSENEQDIFSYLQSRGIEWGPNEVNLISIGLEEFGDLKKHQIWYENISNEKLLQNIKSYITNNTTNLKI